MYILKNKYLDILIQFIKEFIAISLFPFIILVFLYYVLDIKINRPISVLVFMLFCCTIASLLIQRKKSKK